jgi:hypothetical protein
MIDYFLFNGTDICPDDIIQYKSSLGILKTSKRLVSFEQLKCQYKEGVEPAA